MDHIRNIEVMYAVLLTSIQTQVKQIKILGPDSRLRQVFVAHTKELTEIFIASLEKIETEFIEDTEGQTEKQLELSASFTENLVGLKEEYPGFEVFEVMIAKNRAVHKKLTSTLSGVEEEMVHVITGRFKTMKEEALKLLSEIETL